MSNSDGPEQAVPSQVLPWIIWITVIIEEAQNEQGLCSGSQLQRLAEDEWMQRQVAVLARQSNCYSISGRSGEGKCTEKMAGL